MKNVRVFVFTSDKYLWALRPFSYLFNVYWSSLQPVLVAGYAHPNFDLPPNFKFVSIDSENYPANKWSNGVIKFLNMVEDDYFVFMLEDFWLRRTVDHEAINSLVEFCRPRNVFRMDLTTDRLYAHDPRYIPPFDTWGRINIIQSQPDWPYHFSTQCCIINRVKLLQFLEPDWTPWQTELDGSPRLARMHPEWLVLGTRQIPIEYTQGLKSSEPEQVNLNLIPPEHIDEMRKRGYIK